MVPLKVRQLLPVVKAAGRPGTGTSCPAPRQPLPTHPGTRLFVPVVGPTGPVTRPTVQARVKGVPVRRPGVRVEAPAIWVTAPAIPVTRPGVPVADLGVPVTRPTGFTLESVGLLDTCVQFWDTGTSRRPVGRGSCQAQTSRRITARREPRPTGSGWSGRRSGDGAAGAGVKLFSDKMQNGPTSATALLNITCRSCDRLNPVVGDMTQTTEQHSILPECRAIIANHSIQPLTL